MPKRKYHADDKLAKKLRKIEKMLKECKSRRKRIISSSSDSENTTHYSSDLNNDERKSVSLDSILLSHESQQREHSKQPPISPGAEPLLPNNSTSTLSIVQSSPALTTLPPLPTQELPEPMPSTSQCNLVNQIEDTTLPPAVDPSESPDLDNDIIELLGEDPIAAIVYGKDIRPELAARFSHIATNGMNKEHRKELCEKYLIPGNCTMIGAPVLNAEVKVALNDAAVKRDKLIEARQKRVPVAISCLGEAISHALDAKEKDNIQIKRLMDAARLMCEAQYNDSVSLKKEVKEPLLNTKMEKSLFGDNLLDSLKTAKAVTKSGTEMKTPYKTPTKNWRNPVAGRRPPAAGRQNVPAAPMTMAQPAPLPPPLEARNSRAPLSRKPPQQPHCRL